MGATVLISIVLVAAVATAGDFYWYSYGVRHTMVTGVLHGAVLLTAVGAALGAASGNIVRGLPIGTLAGVGGALCFYALAAVLGRGLAFPVAIPVSWMVTWILLAVFEGKWLRSPHRSWQTVAARGALAAIIGGAAFALVAGRLWGPPPEGEERNYALQLATWAFAWAPGLLILTWGSRRPS